MGLHEVFSEVHKIEENNRHVTFKYETKCVDHMPGSEGILNILEGINLT